MPSNYSASSCPLCGSKPQLAVLRPEGDGGKRHLACSLCLVEWEYRRIVCPVCDEVDYAKLPRYTVEEPIAVRVEACDTCKNYQKSFDMTVDGLMVPEVDEMATVALDVWAAGQGYHKIQLNLLGF
jgi:FdhE protein